MVTEEFRVLYTAENPSPLGESVPTMVAPFPIDDRVPTEEEIGTAVKRLKTGKAAGPTGIKAEHFKEWYKESHPEEFYRADRDGDVPAPFTDR